jgi:DNA-binding transcriptional LysR family regulator
VTLTDEGRRFYAQAAPLLEALEDAAAEAGGSAASVRGRLRVNVDPWFSRLLLAPHMGAFMHAHPALAVELIVRDCWAIWWRKGLTWPCASVCRSRPCWWRASCWRHAC